LQASGGGAAGVRGNMRRKRLSEGRRVGAKPARAAQTRRAGRGKKKQRYGVEGRGNFTAAGPPPFPIGPGGGTNRLRQGASETLGLLGSGRQAFCFRESRAYQLVRFRAWGKKPLQSRCGGGTLSKKLRPRCFGVVGLLPGGLESPGTPSILLGREFRLGARGRRRGSFNPRPFRARV